MSIPFPSFSALACSPWPWVAIPFVIVSLPPSFLFLTFPPPAALSLGLFIPAAFMHARHFLSVAGWSSPQFAHLALWFSRVVVIAVFSGLMSSSILNLLSGSCLFLVWFPAHMQHLASLLHLATWWPSFQHLLHCSTGGLSACGTTSQNLANIASCLDFTSLSASSSFLNSITIDE
ncbi:hypothetical protein H2248_003657 [Termitomyces sp. 'cryptogamus']|nr:hypothetical protein H2248_003657 [Termitomyces sp. 'cryptogamus']